MKQHLLNSLILLFALIAGTATSWADDVVCYTLTPASGSNNSYAGNCDVEIDEITWNLTGNSTFQPWRIGGKSLSGVDRALYSKTAIGDNVTKIEVTHGAASSITVNSWTVIVSTDADFTNIVSTLTPSFAASTTTTINRPVGKDWSNCYFKFIYNVTVSGSSNKYVEFSEAKFYKDAPAAAVATPTFSVEEGAYTTAQSVELSCATDGATIYYTLDGSVPTESSTVYSSAIAVATTTTIKAKAFKGEDASSVATATYTIILHAGTAEDPYTVADARNAIDANTGLTNVYVKGIVCEGGSSLSSGAMNYWISDDGSETDKFEIYKGKGLSGADFTDESDVQVGDEVVVYGTIKKYGTTYEFNNGSQIYSFNRPGVATTIVTWDLSKKSYTTEEDLVTWSSSYVTMTNATATGGTSATNYLGGDANNRTSSRFYKNNTLTITPASGYMITRVVFTATSENYASALANSTWSNATAAASETTVTVTPTDGVSAFTATIGGTCGFTAVKVYYQAVATINIAAACTDGEGNYYGTYSNSKAFIVPADLTVYEVSVIDGELYMEEYDKDDVVPANTGVLVAGDAGEHDVVLTTGGTSKLGADNMLKASGDDGIDATSMNVADTKFYRLTMHEGTQIGFFWGAAGGAAFDIAANKAYLAVPNDKAGEVKGFRFGENTDAISEIMRNGENEKMSAIYDLSGRRVMKPTKGLYIVNGKKVVK